MFPISKNECGLNEKSMVDNLKFSSPKYISGTYKASRGKVSLLNNTAVHGFYCVVLLNLESKIYQ